MARFRARVRARVRVMVRCRLRVRVVSNIALLFYLENDRGLTQTCAYYCQDRLMLQTWIDLHSPNNPERRTFFSHSSFSRIGAKQVGNKNKQKNRTSYSSVVDGICTLAMEQIPLVRISHFPTFFLTCI